MQLAMCFLILLFLSSCGHLNNNKPENLSRIPSSQSVEEGKKVYQFYGGLASLSRKIDSLHSKLNKPTKYSDDEISGDLSSIQSLESELSDACRSHPRA